MSIGTISFIAAIAAFGGAIAFMLIKSKADDEDSLTIQVAEDLEKELSIYFADEG